MASVVGFNGSSFGWIHDRWQTQMTVTVIVTHNESSCCLRRIYACEDWRCQTNSDWESNCWTAGWQEGALSRCRVDCGESESSRNEGSIVLVFIIVYTSEVVVSVYTSRCTGEVEDPIHINLSINQSWSLQLFLFALCLTPSLSLLLILYLILSTVLNLFSILLVYLTMAAQEPISFDTIIQAGTPWSNTWPIKHNLTTPRSPEEKKRRPRK